MHVRILNENENVIWDRYVLQHPESTHCHLYNWKPAFEDAYNISGFYLIAENGKGIRGVLPLFYIKSLILPNSLISIPYLNYGGGLADSKDIYLSLLEFARDLSGKLAVSHLELRHIHPNKVILKNKQIDSVEKTDRVRMMLALPESSQILFKSFKAKLRSQIRRPEKEEMKAEVGGLELLNDFYKVFSINMRDIGSPVHSLKFFRKILEYFNRNVKIGVVKYRGEPAASGIVITFKDTVEIPWASSLKKYNKFSPNMLLYWSLIKNSCDEGYKYFDFGRSPVDSGTYRFKKQWGAEPDLLHWYHIYNEKDIKSFKASDDFSSHKYAILSSMWSKLPVGITNILGPKFRRAIPL